MSRANFEFKIRVSDRNLRPEFPLRDRICPVVLLWI